jgi:hypothetical protein
MSDLRVFGVFRGKESGHFENREPREIHEQSLAKLRMNFLAQRIVQSPRSAVHSPGTLLRSEATAGRLAARRRRHRQAGTPTLRREV